MATTSAFRDTSCLTYHPEGFDKRISQPPAGSSGPIHSTVDRRAGAAGLRVFFSNVEKRIAFTLPDLRREIFCFEIPTLAASSRERFTPLVKDLDIREMAVSKPLAERIPPCEIRP